MSRKFPLLSLVLFKKVTRYSCRMETAYCKYALRHKNVLYQNQVGFFFLDFMGDFLHIEVPIVARLNIYVCAMRIIYRAVCQWKQCGKMKQYRTLFIFSPGKILHYMYTHRSTIIYMIYSQIVLPQRIGYGHGCL